MGYRVASFLSVSPSDTHDHFFYYLSTRWLAYEWINEWIDSRFDLLASRLGPANAVLITASKGSSAEEWALYGALERASTGDAVEVALHAGAPTLIVSRRPLRFDEGDRHIDCAVVNLAAYDELGMACLFDGLIEEIRRGGDPLTAIPEAPDLTGEGYEWLKAFELKPNVFGLGVNGNAVIELIREWRQRRRKTDPESPAQLPRGEDRKS